MSVVQGQPIFTADSASSHPAPHAIATTSQPAPPAIANEEAALRALAGLGFPAGLSKELVSSTTAFPVRFWVVDNSGSMNTNDGTRLVPLADGRLQPIKSTRWNEMVDTILGIGQMAEALGARTDFHLLNPTPHGQYLSLGGEANVDVQRLGEPVTLATLTRRFKGMSPTGGTPLTESVTQIVSLLEPAAAKMRAQGQRAVVVLATDGLPNDKASFLQALRQLQRLPVWLVVRLCTDDDAVVGYWNDLDSQLECDMEVLDDEIGEAREVHGVNGWLRYGPLLHRAREFGLHNKLFDLLDEQALVASQIKQFCEMMLGCGVLPEPEADPAAFRAAVRESLSGVAPVFDPVSRTMKPWVNAQKLCPKKGFLSCILG